MSATVAGRSGGLIDSYDSLNGQIAVLGSGRRLADEADVLAILSEPQVVVLRWPAEAEAAAAARRQHQPRFLVVEGDDGPPARWDPMEEWVRLPADRRDVEARLAALRCRAAEGPPRPSVDGYDRLLYGGQWVALTPSDYRLIEPLVEHFDEVVPYEQVLTTEGPADGTARVAGRVRLTRLRRRIAPLGLEIRTVRPHGLALTAAPDPRPA
ncbi:MAG: hypothetical protein JOZ99_11535 [Actinobacteria bacterium]|nr:hypothetical protein [Actinomycetota bacterium]